VPDADNEGSYGVLEKSGQIASAKGHHPITLRYFQAGGEKAEQVFIEGQLMGRRETKSNMLGYHEE